MRSDPTDLVRVEKNLNSLGFFAATYKRISQTPIRSIECGSREVNGKRTTQKAQIEGSATLGLPSGADRDKYYAFMKIVEERRRLTGGIDNPVRFTGYELLSSLGLKPSGSQYQEIENWLTRMVSTTITSEWAVYLRGTRKFVKDTFHVFDRAVRVGQEMADGRIADCNYVWLSSWQLENINANFLLALDLKDYLSLRNDIAKAILFHLNVWFYASHGAPIEKRYDRLCELLGVRPRSAVSLIRQAFNPGMNELIALGYLSSWDVAPLESAKREYKIILRPGRRYQAQPMADSIQEKIVDMLVKRGIREDVVRRLLLDIPADQPVQEQIEYFDYLRSRMKEKMTSPPGFLVAMIRQNATIPREFITSSQREAESKASQPSHEEQEAIDRSYQEMRMKDAYLDYCERSVREFVAKNQERVSVLKMKAQREIRRRDSNSLATNGHAFDRQVHAMVNEGILRDIAIESFEEWLEKKQLTLF